MFKTAVSLAAGGRLSAVEQPATVRVAVHNKKSEIELKFFK